MTDYSTQKAQITTLLITLHFFLLFSFHINNFLNIQLSDISRISQTSIITRTKISRHFLVTIGLYLSPITFLSKMFSYSKIITAQNTMGSKSQNTPQAFTQISKVSEIKYSYLLRHVGLYKNLRVEEFLDCLKR